ncbi:uncharacterized protein SOCE836_034560 [Sorangium cellulosum]|uniref:Uncharacterized protein n=1 Tax=Sorangium cellulosum TaxID=56 RepID=A0A4P2QML2_SORCE|nr:uncharacterized protein SOCE836_034560 [Sorangium cellulosum]WCQ90710.1 hypothetical protein NQZ70_03421 [Sorangium sp. Soce836]
MTLVLATDFSADAQRAGARLGPSPASNGDLLRCCGLS